MAYRVRDAHTWRNVISLLYGWGPVSKIFNKLPVTLIISTASTAARYRFPSDHRSQAPLGLVTTRMGDHHLLGKPSRCTKKKAIVMVRGLLQPRTRVMRAHTRSRWQGPFQSGGIGPGESPLKGLYSCALH